MIGVVVHGGIQESSHIPAWEVKMVKLLKAEGYDEVIAYDWASQSTTPGEAVKQGPKLGNILRKASTDFPAGEPVDLHLIGHSEGAVVASQALLSLQHKSTPNLEMGYVKLTLLDPHAANNDAPGGVNASVASGLNGQFAHWLITMYQELADDPLVTVPDIVDDAEVYYQKTPVQDDGSNDSLYNLWGQVPVGGKAAQYSNLTGAGIAHSGGKGIQVWYAFHVIPTLGDGDNVFINPTRLTASRVGGGETIDSTGKVATVQGVAGAGGSYAGTAAPGQAVTLVAKRVMGNQAKRIGGAVADASGDWTIASEGLGTGVYQVTARALVPEGLPSPKSHFYVTKAVERLVVRSDG